ncbi:hypothetical protein D3C83_56430 [compost metagenome]
MQAERAAAAFHPRQHQFFAPREEFGDEARGLELAAKTRVGHDAAGFSVSVEREQARRDTTAQGFSLVGGERIAPREHLLADFALRTNSD